MNPAVKLNLTPTSRGQHHFALKLLGGLPAPPAGRSLYLQTACPLQINKNQLIHQLKHFVANLKSLLRAKLILFRQHNLQKCTVTKTFHRGNKENKILTKINGSQTVCKMAIK